MAFVLENDLATKSQDTYNGLGSERSIPAAIRQRAMGVNNKQKTADPQGFSLPRIDASTLLASGREIILVHKDTEYRLRLTSNDKLILTK
jgi:hemin uptake protein HemP